MSENKNFFRVSAEDFKKIPGSPVAYWVSERVRSAEWFLDRINRIYRIESACGG